jgi:hypothetical protein
LWLINYLTLNIFNCRHLETEYTVWKQNVNGSYKLPTVTIISSFIIYPKILSKMLRFLKNHIQTDRPETDWDRTHVILHFLFLLTKFVHMVARHPVYICYLLVILAGKTAKQGLSEGNILLYNSFREIFITKLWVFGKA